MKLTINELKLIKNKVKGTVTWDEIEAMAAQILKDQEALAEAREYFDDLSDADCGQDGFIPNKEMTLLVEIETALLPKE